MANAADTMSQVMVEGVTNKLRDGALSEAITTADRYLSSLDSQNANVMGAFGATMATLHFLRGTARRAQAVEAPDASLLAAAESDLDRGLALIQQHGSASDAATMASLAGAVRAASGSANEVVAAFVGGARSLRGRRGSGGGATGASAMMPTAARLAEIVGFALLGGLLWTMSLWLFTRIEHAAGGSLWMLLGVAPLYLLIYAGLRGWRWYSQYPINTVGGMIKCFALLFLGISVVGTLPVLYWTGKGVWETFAGRS